MKAWLNHENSITKKDNIEYLYRCNSDKETPLFLAVRTNNIKMIKIILQYNTYLEKQHLTDHRNKDNETPLGLARRLQLEEVIKCLQSAYVLSDESNIVTH